MQKLIDRLHPLSLHTFSFFLSFLFFYILSNQTQPPKTNHPAQPTSKIPLPRHINRHNPLSTRLLPSRLGRANLPLLYPGVESSFGTRLRCAVVRVSRRESFGDDAEGGRRGD